MPTGVEGSATIGDRSATLGVRPARCVPDPVRCGAAVSLRAYQGLVEAVGGLLLPVERGEAGAPVARGRLVADEEPDEHLRVGVVGAHEGDGLVQELGLLRG